MEIIQNNPYRIAGILSNATAKELQKQKSKIKAYTKVGKEINFDIDFPILEKINRTENSIKQAFSSIEQNQDKVNYSLFWFLKVSTFDEPAIKYLIDGNKEKAEEIWSKVTANKSLNSKNFSSFNNIGTLKLLSNSSREVKEGIESKIKLIQSSYFEKYVYEVADLTFTIDSQKQSEQFIAELLKQFKNKFSTKETLSLFSNCNEGIQKYLSKKITEGPIHSIEIQIESTKNKRKSNKRNAYDFGLSLLGETKNDLAILKSLLGLSNLQYKMIADSLAKEAMQCGIDYFQEWQDTRDESKKSISLLTRAQNIAINPQIKERAKDNIEGMKEWALTAPIQEELEFITSKLTRFHKLPDTIANANDLVASCKPKLQKIKNTLGAHDEYYINISSAIVNNAQGMIIAATNDEQELFGLSVNPNSINMDKIVDIAVRRQLTGSPENILNSLLTASKYQAIAKLKTVINGALSLSKTLGTLDMHGELRARYNSNHKTLKSIASQLGIGNSSPNSTNSSSRSASSSSSSSGNSSDSGGDYAIMFGGIGLIIGLIMGIEAGAIMTAIIGAIIGANIKS